MLSDKFRSILGREPQQQYQELSPSPDTDISSIESNEKCCAHCSQNAENTTTPTRGILLRHAQRVVLIISLVFNLAMLAIWMVPLKDSPPEQSKGLRSDAFFGDSKSKEYRLHDFRIADHVSSSYAQRGLGERLALH